MITTGEEGGCCFALGFVTCDVHCGLFILPLGVISRLCSVIVANYGHLFLFFFFQMI